MPPPCHRCRQCPPGEGDTWCLACTGWEALGRDLAGTWDSPGCRAIAADLVVTCVRQVRALRGLGAGLARAPGLASEAGVSRAHGAGKSRARSEVPPAVTPKSGGLPLRGALPRRRSDASNTPPPPHVKDEISDRGGGAEDAESEEEETIEEEAPVDPEHRPVGGSGDRRPPEPKGPPPGRREEERKHRGASHTDRDRDRRERGSDRSRRDRDRTRSGKRRGGRKHQRLWRLAQDPSTPVHRKPSEDFWNLSSQTLGQQALGRL